MYSNSTIKIIGFNKLRLQEESNYFLYPYRGIGIGGSVAPGCCNGNVPAIESVCILDII